MHSRFTGSIAGNVQQYSNIPVSAMIHFEFVTEGFVFLKLIAHLFAV